MQKKQLFTFTVLCAIMLCVPWHGLRAQDNPKVLFSENFNDVAVGSLPDGWSTESAYPFSVQESETHVTDPGSKFAWSDAWNNAGTKVSLTSPEIQIPSGTEYNLSLKYYSNPVFSVYVQMNNENTLLIQSNSISSAYTDPTWREFKDISLSTYTGKTIRLVFEYTGNNGSKCVGIDNIVVELPPTCAQPQNLNVLDVQSGAAKLGWTMPEGTAGAVAGQYVYTLNGESDASYVIDDFKVEGSAYSAVISAGLKPSTEYTVAVIGYCGDGDESKPSDAIQFTTSCAPSSFEEFVGAGKVYDLSKTIPVCWDFIGTPTFSSYMNGVEIEEKEKLYTAELSFGLNDVELAISARNSSGYNSKSRLCVGLEYRKADGTLVDHGEVEKYTLPAEFQECILNLDKTVVSDEVGTWRLYFYPEAEGNQYQSHEFYLNQVEVYRKPAFDPVTDVYVAGTGKNSITLGWENDDVTGVYYILEYVLDGGEARKVAVSGKEYSIEDLTSQTRYSVEGKVWVSASDDVEGTELSRSFSFKFDNVDTKGDPIEISATGSWSENFSGMTAKQREMPIGWRSNDKGENSYFYIEKEQIGFNNSSYTGSKTVLLPEFAFDSSVGEYRFSFYMQRYTYSDRGGKLNIYLLADETVDVTGLTAAKTIALSKDGEPAVADGKSYFYSVDFAPIVDGKPVKYVLVEVVPDNGWPIYLDNFTVAVKPEVEPVTKDPVVSEITNNSVVITVDIPEDYGFEAAYVPAGEEFTETNISVSETSSVSITGLTGNTSYDIYVRAVNGDKKSAWSDNKVTIRTLCDPETIGENGWSDSFEAETTGDISGSSVKLSDVPCYTANANIYADDNSEYSYGNYTLKAKDGKRYFYSTSRNGSFYFFKRFDLEAGTTYRMSAFGFAQNSSVQGSVTLKMICTAEFESGNVGSYVPFLTSAIKIETNGNTQNWKEHVAYFTVPENGVYYLGMEIVAESFGSSYSTGVFAVDMWSVEKIAIAPVTATVRPSADKVEFAFEGGDEGDIYQLRISETEFNAGEEEIENKTDWALSYDEIESSSYSWTADEGVKPATKYYYSVRRTSDFMDFSPWSVVQSFETPCADINAEGYTEGFISDAVLKCWTNIAGSATVYPERKEDGRIGLLSIDKGAVIASPHFASLDGYTLKGYVLAFTAGNTFEVGTIDTEGNFVSLGTFVTETGWKYMPFAVDFKDLDFLPAQFVFKAVSSSFYIDDLSLVKVTCPASASGDITGISRNSVSVKLSTTGSEQEWKVIARPEKGDDVVLENITDITVPVEVTGLTPNTAYTLYVVSVCSDTDSSDEVRIGTVTTDCDIQALPYSNNLYGYSLPQCWTVEPDKDMVAYTWKAVGAEGLTAAIDFSDMTMDEAVAVVYTPEFAIDEAAVVSFTFVTPYVSGTEYQAKLSVMIVDEEGNEHATSITDAVADGKKGMIQQVPAVTLTIGKEFAGKNIRLAFKAKADKSSGVNSGTVKTVFGNLSVSNVYDRYVLGSFNNWSADAQNIMQFDIKTGEYRYETILAAGEYEFKVSDMEQAWSLGFNNTDADKSHKGYGKADNADNIVFSVPRENTVVRFCLVENTAGEKGYAIAVTSSCGYFAKEVVPFTVESDIPLIEGVDNTMSLTDDFAVYKKIYRNVTLEATTYRYAVVAENGYGYPAPGEFKELTVEEAGNYDVTFTYNLNVGIFEGYVLSAALSDPTLVTPEIIVESTSGVIGDDHTVTFDNVKFGSHPEFVLTVKGMDLMGDITVSVSGDNSDNITSDKDVVTISEAESGVDVKFVISADSRDGGSASITFTSAGAADYLIPVVWTVDRSTVGVDNVSLNSVVYSTGGVVYVKALEGSEIAVYSIQGHPIATATAESGLTAINGIDAGVVIISVNGVAHKVVVR